VGKYSFSTGLVTQFGYF